MYLSSFSMIEPSDNIYLYAPSWLNVWESHMYNQAIKSTKAHAWGFKRFGTQPTGYTKEMIRTPSYKEYIDAMEQTADIALQNLTAKQRMQLFKLRTAFIYVDSWGETSPFENISSALDTATIDTLPKSLIKKFAVKDFSCKLRGERQSLVQALKMAEDYLAWDLFDFVVLCVAHRAVPVLAFSEEDLDLYKKKKKQPHDFQMNLSVERVGCFIFSQQQSLFKIQCGHFSASHDLALLPKATETENIPEFTAITGIRTRTFTQQLTHLPAQQIIHLNNQYGSSGCISPALSWVHLEHHVDTQSKMRTIVPDNFGGYSWFDTWYL